MMTINDYKFNIGDEVITFEGEKGTIVDICDCEACKKRGFLELIWEDEDGDERWITDYDAKHQFKHFYKIGNYRFDDFCKTGVERRIAEYELALARLRRQLKTIEEFEDREEYEE